jgi:hypothetical protein
MSNRTGRWTGRGENALSKAEIFDVLQNQRRRYVLQYLKRFEGPVELSDLATQVAAWEYDTAVEEVTKEQKKRVYTTLQQTHIERMADAGIIEYDDDAHVVERTPHTEDLTVYLEVVPGGEFPWHEYYLSLAAVSLAILVALWADLFLLTLLSPLAWAGLIVAAFTISAVYHTYSSRRRRIGEDELGVEPPDEPE